MSITVVRKEETQQSGKSAVQHFEDVASKEKELKAKMSILAELFAKKPTDNFTVAVPPYDKDDFINQGDIMIFPEGTEMYDMYIKTFEVTGEAKNMNLQKGVSMTGNHELCPMPGSKWSITDGKIKVKNMASSGARDISWDAKLCTCDEPFTLYHDQHGNVTMYAPKFLACIQVDAKTYREVRD